MTMSKMNQVINKTMEYDNEIKVKITGIIIKRVISKKYALKRSRHQIFCDFFQVFFVGWAKIATP